MSSVARSIPPQSPLYNRLLLQFSRLFTFFNDEDLRKIPCAQYLDCSVKPNSIDRSPVSDLDSVEDEEIVKSVIDGIIPSYSLETKLGDCKRAAAVRREAVQRITGKSLTGLPLEGLDYNSILGQCCEMPIGYVHIPVGIAGPLLLDGIEYSVPMATTEACLVASTNRGCKAIHLSGGAFSVLLKDAMTRAPVVRFPSARRAALAMFYLQDPANFRDCLSCSISKFANLLLLVARMVTLMFLLTYFAVCGIDRVDLLGFRESHTRLLERISMRGFRVVLAMLWG